MEHCANCRHWEEVGDDVWKKCDRIRLFGKRLWREEVDGQKSIETPSSFRCNEFKKKPKGPFIVLKSSGFDVWNIFIAMPHEEIRILQGTKVRMDEIAALLNEQWAIAKEEGTE